jgi:hypothetical protein
MRSAEEGKCFVTTEEGALGNCEKSREGGD